MILLECYLSSNPTKLFLCSTVCFCAFNWRYFVCSQPK